MLTAVYRSRDRADKAAEKIKVFAQPLRLMILSYLLEGEHAVGDIEAATGIGQPALSQQLAELRRAGLVQTRRAAKQVHYRLADEATVLCVRSIEAIFGSGDRIGVAPPPPPLEASPARETAGRSGAASFATIVPIDSRPR